MIDRRDDWRARLFAFLDEAARKPLVPGDHDCALFFSDAVKAMTDVDHAESFRGKYTTLAGGIKLLRKAGHDDHVALAASLFPEIHPSHAQVGDGVAFDTGDGTWALGVVIGERSMVLREDGLGTMLTLDASRAFRVG